MKKIITILSIITFIQNTLLPARNVTIKNCAGKNITCEWIWYSKALECEEANPTNKNIPRCYLIDIFKKDIVKIKKNNTQTIRHALYLIDDVACSEDAKKPQFFGGIDTPSKQKDDWNLIVTKSGIKKGTKCS